MITSSPAANQEQVYDWNIDNAVDNAEASGFTVIQSETGILLLDLDDTESKRHYDRTIKTIAEYFGIMELERWRSKSGEGWHIKLACSSGLDFIHRVALQACLGSDRKREGLALMMHKDGLVNPSWLFKPKPKP